MALTRAKKTEKVKALAIELEHSTSAIVGTFTGLTAAKDYGLRKAIRGRRQLPRGEEQAGGARRRGNTDRGGAAGLKGVSSVAYTSGDPVALAKALAAG